METKERTIITVKSSIQAPVEKVWESWTKPEHITQWNQASDDWHSPRAQNDVREGGQFNVRMESKDGTMGFDFGGVYNTVRKNEYIAYTMDDGRRVEVTFTPRGQATEVIESFEAEETHSVDMQRGGWQAILDNFKKYTESLP